MKNALMSKAMRGYHFVIPIFKVFFNICLDPGQCFALMANATEISMKYNITMRMIPIMLASFASEGSSAPNKTALSTKKMMIKKGMRYATLMLIYLTMTEKNFLGFVFR